MANSTQSYAWHHQSLGKHKLKVQGDSIIYTLEWLNLKFDNTKCWQGRGANETLLHCWWDNVKGATILENSLTSSYKVKHTAKVWPRPSTPRYLSKKRKSYLHRETYVHGSIIHKSPKLDKVRCIQTMDWKMSRGRICDRNIGYVCSSQSLK